MKTLDPNEFNSGEMSMLYRLADGSFFGKLTTEKWMKITKCSKAAAFRDTRHPVSKGFLIPSDDVGRNRGYFFNAYLLFNLFYNHLLESGIKDDHIMRIQLDDLAKREYRDPEKLYGYVKSRISDQGQYYILLDEV